MIDLHCRQGLAHDKVREMRELILQRYDKNFDGRLEINEVCVKTAFDNANRNNSHLSSADNSVERSFWDAQSETNKLFCICKLAVECSYF